MATPLLILPISLSCALQMVKMITVEDGERVWWLREPTALAEDLVQLPAHQTMLHAAKEVGSLNTIQSYKVRGNIWHVAMAMPLVQNHLKFLQHEGNFLSNHGRELLWGEIC